jgi:HlyD family secretion protein
MPQKTASSRKWLAVLLSVAAAVLLFFLFRPSPINVETAKAARGLLRVTVDEDGETRAHDRFVVAAPIAGRLLRVDLEEGNNVAQNAMVAKLEPLPLNQQQREEVLARIEAAEATKHQADARLAHAQEDHEQSRRDLIRAEALAKQNVLSVQMLEQARNAEITNREELGAAKFSALAAASEVKVARAGLVGMETGNARQKIITLRSPVAGRVLRIVEKSERVVLAGAPVLVIGDPSRIEVVSDVLTTDAVNVKPGAPVYLEGWGGDHPLLARVRLIEPAGFTKISALGVEEKRVNVIADFVDPPDGLADGYRVETRIVTWEGQNVLKIPGSAAFREGDAWGVFTVEHGRARGKIVAIGHRSQTEVEILQGLVEGEVVILHPSNQLKDGAPVRVQ